MKYETHSRIGLPPHFHLSKSQLLLLGFCTFSNYKTLKNLVRSLQATIGHLLKKSVTTPLPFQHQRKKTSFEFLLFEFDHFCHLKMAFALWSKHKKNESLSKATIHFSLVEKFNWHKFVFDLLTFRSILHSDETVRIIQQHIADKFIFTEKNCKFNWWMNFLQISLFLLIQVMIITQLLLMAISLYKCFSCMRREIEIPYPLSLTTSWLPKIYICGKNIFKVCFLNNPTTFAMFIYYFQKYFNFINSQNGVSKQISPSTQVLAYPVLE